jgi:hypothetical protein
VRVVVLLIKSGRGSDKAGLCPVNEPILVRYCPAHYRGPRFRGAAGASGAAGVQEAPSWLNDVSERVCVRVTLL